MLSTIAEGSVLRGGAEDRRGLHHICISRDFLEGAGKESTAKDDPLGCLGDLGWACARMGKFAYGVLNPVSAQVIHSEATAENGPSRRPCVFRFEVLAIDVGGLFRRGSRTASRRQRDSLFVVEMPHSTRCEANAPRRSSTSARTARSPATCTVAMCIPSNNHFKIIGDNKF